MPVKIDALTDNPAWLKLAIALARAVPSSLGYAIAGFVGERIATRREARQVRAVRTNQWIVSGERAASVELDQAVKTVFQHSARAIYDLYHYLQDHPKAERLFVIEPSFQALLDRPEFTDRGLVIVGLHMCGFDLGLQWICRHKWVNPLVLTLPNLQGGHRVEFEMRQRTGMNLVPGTVSGLRQAVRQLNQGGIVATGLDHPFEDCQPRPRFFGRPASLPTHHVSLALKTHTPVALVACRLEQAGKYHLFSTGSYEMESFPDHTEELLYNTEKLLAEAEGIIRQTPEQWGVFKPVWPECMDQVPGQTRHPA